MIYLKQQVYCKPCLSHVRVCGEGGGLRHVVHCGHLRSKM